MSPRKFFSVMVVAQRDAFADERDFSGLLDVLLANHFERGRKTGEIRMSR